jgi:hypothetical protein
VIELGLAQLVVVHRATAEIENEVVAEAAAIAGVTQGPCGSEELEFTTLKIPGVASGYAQSGWL